jgi:hypothetical protein
MTPPLNDRTAATRDALVAWLESDAPRSRSGAYVAWIERDGRQAYEDPEITGYALTHLSAHMDRPRSREAAPAAAAWLERRLATGERTSGWDGDAVYTFDLGMIATGFLAHVREGGGEPRYAERAQSLIEDLARLAASPEGIRSFPPEGPASPRVEWSTLGRAHLIKLMICLALGERSEALRRLLALAGDLQHEDGRMATEPDEGSPATTLHPHLYAVEGLWAYGTAAGEAEARERARRGAEWALRQQLPSGGIPSFVDTQSGQHGPEQMDATAQATRMGVACGLEPARWEGTLARVVEAAEPSGEGMALPYQPSGPATHLGTWAAQFGAQALDWALDSTRIGWRLLV